VRTVAIVLAVLFVLWPLKKAASWLFNAFMTALVLRTRTCTLGCKKAGTATYLLINPDKPAAQGMPVCEDCVCKRKGPPLEWMVSRGFLKPLAPKGTP
jgi:hypothetical protein